MGPLWLAGLALLCASAVQLAAVPSTTETLVVAADGAPTGAPPAPAGPATGAPPAPIKLTSMDVTSEVALRYARTAVVTKVRNPSGRAQEATFRVLLPETAFISGFVMTLNGKAFKAYVKEKEEAKQIYSQAVSQGIGAAHIATKARDSNHFTVSVNVEPTTEAVFNLTYEELLTRRNGLYNQAINLHPGTLVPSLRVTVHIKEGQKISQLRVPHVRTGNEVDATEDDEQNTKAVIKRSADEKEATITFEPDLEEQKRLVNVYAEKSKESKLHAHRPWYTHQEEEPAAEGVLGQFVVQYDVDRPKEGEILVNDGYFVHFFAPPGLPPLSKHAVFVLDTSGSMMERKIQQLRDAMRSILADLNPGDYFSVVEFSSYVRVHDLDAPPAEAPASGYWRHDEPPAVLVPPYRATPENKLKAQALIARLTADGGTNIYQALEVALELIHKGVDWTPAPAAANGSTATTTTITTDAQPAAPAADKQLAEPSPKKEPPQLEPIIIFLTDGDPTVGETDPRRIIARLSEKNYGANKATIFSLAFGEDADRSFLRKLSLRNNGFMRHIYEAADAALQLRDFYRQVASPLLADVRFTYPADQVKESSVTKHKFRTFYLGSEAVVAGKLQEAASELTPQVHAFCGNDDGITRKKYEIFPKIPVARAKNAFLPLERLWAYLTIKQLLDERDAAEDAPPTDAPPAGAPPAGAKPAKETEKPEKQALELALKYEFVTALTSLVVVKPNATDAVDAESVDRDQNIMPQSYATPLVANYGAPGQASNFLAAQYPPPGQQSSASGSFFAPAASFEDADSPVEALEAANFNEEESLDTFLNRIIGGPAPLVPMYSYPMPSYNRIVGGAAGAQDRIFGGPPAAQGFGMGGLPDFADYDDDIVSAFPSGYAAGQAASKVSVVPSMTPPAASTTPRAEPPLQRYRLQQYPWTEPLLDAAAGVLNLPANGTVVVLKLSEDKGPSPDAAAACARATDGAAGLCVYLTRCEAAQALTPALYADTYCKVDAGFAGVCCPKISIVERL